MTRPAAALLLVLTVTVGTLSGCGGMATSAGSSSSTSTASATPTATGSGTPSTADGTASTPAPPPPGMRLLTAKASGLRLAAPRDWTVLSAAAFRDPAVKHRLTEYAKGLGLTYSQLRVTLRSVDLLVAAAALKPADQININVTHLAMLSGIPTNAALRAQLAAINATVDRIGSATTGVGPGRLIEFELPVPGNRVAYGAAVLVELTNGVAQVTATAGRPERAAALLDQVMPTFRDVG